MNIDPPCTRSARERYDPWRQLHEQWPEIAVRTQPMPGRLLGWIRYPVIALRAGTTAAQRRCTLAHEIVHLERGITECGPWAAHEERQVHAIAARRLITLDDLACAVREYGPTYRRVLAQALEVDGETMAVRLELLSDAERRLLAAQTREVWAVA